MSPVVVLLVLCACRAAALDSCDNETCYDDLDVENMTVVTEIDNDTTLTAVTEIDIDNTTGVDPHTEKPFLNRAAEVEFCVCDLQIDYCDLSCCCDPDCTYDNKLIFERCSSDTQSTASNCYNAEVIYRNNTPFRWYGNENGLFCILKNNLPTSYVLQNSKAITNLGEAKKIISSQRSWAKPYKSIDELFTNKSMRFGHQVWILKHDKLEKFSVPSPYITPACIGLKAIKYLHDFKSQCVYLNPDENTDALSAEKYYKNITFISAHGLNATYIKINTFKCNTFDRCQKSENATNLNLTCNINLYKNEQTCLNAVKGIKYIIYHNGTHGITQINQYIHLINFTHYISNNYEYLINYEVIFVWGNSSSNFSSQRSGNPGYLMGANILVGDLNNLNVTNIIQNPFDVTKNWLVLPVSVKGLCVLDNSTYKSVGFGYNSVTGCSVVYKFKISDLNASSLCQNLQRRIYGLWPLNVTQHNKKYVGQFGNSDRDKFSDWTELVCDNANNTITGQLLENNRLICNNIVRSLDVNIFYSRIDFNDLKRQAKIVGAFLSLGEPSTANLHLYSDKSLNLYVEQEIRMQTMFFDVSAAKTKKFVRPPKFKIKLPHDFFYPFMSDGFRVIVNELLMYLGLIIIYLSTVL